jgi:hypothetical protein
MTIPLAVPPPLLLLLLLLLPLASLGLVGAAATWLHRSIAQQSRAQHSVLDKYTSHVNHDAGRHSGTMVR